MCCLSCSYVGRPVTEKIVTVTGDGIANPQNFRVKIGTSFADLIEAAGGLNEPVEKVISGGPMMGFAMYDYHVPIVKTSSAILCLKKDEVTAVEATACTCGRCVSASGKTGTVKTGDLFRTWTGRTVCKT